MVSISRINAGQLTDYIEKLIAKEENSALTNIDLMEIQDYFRIWPDDTFLMVKCTGDITRLEQEIGYIKFPKKCFGKIFVVNGNKDIPINSMLELKATICQDIHNEEWSTLLTWFLQDNVQDVELVLISKVFDAETILEDKKFSSLWDAIIADLDVTNNKGYYDCLRKVNWKINDDTLEIHTNGVTRNSFIMALKKQEIEKNIYEYTGKRMFVEIK